MAVGSSNVVGLSLTAMMVTALAILISHAAPAPREASELFDVRSAQQLLLGLQDGLGPHPLATAENALIRERLVQALRAAGYDVELQSTYACSKQAVCGYVSNVVGYRSKPTQRNGILLSAHYDSVASSPGASDNGVNLAIALEIARSHKASEAGNPLVLLFADGEEVGSLGALAFVQQYPLAKQIAAVVNLEARGTSGRSIMFESSADNSALIEVLRRSEHRSKANSLLPAVYRVLGNDTDFTVFEQAGVPGYNFAFIDAAENYHSSGDSLSSVDPGSFADQGMAAAALIKNLLRVDVDLLSVPANRRVFTDIAERWFVSWPFWFSAVLGTSGAVVWLYAVLVAPAYSAHRIRIACAALCLFAATIAASAVCYGVMQAIARIQPKLSTWLNFPLETKIVIWICSTAVAAVLFDVATRKYSYEERLLGIAGYFACLGALLGWYAPGASYLYLLPLAAWLPCLPITMLAPRHSRLLCGIGGLLLVCSYAFLAADTAHLLEQGLTLGAAGFLLALLLAPLGALLAAISYSTRFERHAMVAAYVACLLVLAVLTSRMSRPVEVPVREVANAIYFDQRDAAYWLVDRRHSQLVTGLREHGFRSISDRMPLKGAYPQASVAPAPVNLVEARAAVKVATADDGWRRISIVLEPAPLQTFVRLSLPPGTRCENFTIDDGQLSAPMQVAHVQDSQITLYGRYDAWIGLEIACRTGAGQQYAVVEEVASQPGFQQAAWWADFEQAYRSQNRGTRSTLRSSLPL